MRSPVVGALTFTSYNARYIPGARMHAHFGVRSGDLEVGPASIGGSYDPLRMPSEPPDCEIRSLRRVTTSEKLTPNHRTHPLLACSVCAPQFWTGAAEGGRSEERRVGKECGRQWTQAENEHEEERRGRECSEHR